MIPTVWALGAKLLLTCLQLPWPAIHQLIEEEGDIGIKGVLNCTILLSFIIFKCLGIPYVK